MINRVILMGRIAQDLEVKQTQSGNSVLSFSLAVQRNYAKQGEERETDFINCVAWRNQAEFIGKYFRKGSMIAIEGNLRTRNYDDKNDVKHYITEVYVDSVSFTGEKSESADNKQSDQINHSNQSSGKAQSGTNHSTTKPPVHDSQEYDDSMSLDDFDGVLSDDGVPF
ncbi:MAG: single-stranded DNA-binding protein [Oscillospiraceae bacterium]